MLWKQIGELLETTYIQWDGHRAPRLGAALAYYTVVSLAPLLIIAIAIVGLVFGPKAAQGQIVDHIRNLIGDKPAETVQTLVQNAHRPASGAVATAFGIVTLLFGASGVFGEIVDALNMIWGVRRPSGFSVLRMLKNRFQLFLVVIGAGFLLLASLLVTAWLSVVGKYVGELLPTSGRLLQLVNFGISFAVASLLFAIIYKVLPDTYVSWRDVWVGATFTALLFSVGKLLIGIYLGRSSLASVYGAAGSVIIILLWIYYSAQIFYMGAEFTQVYACRYGSRRQVQPAAQTRVA